MTPISYLRPIGGEYWVLEVSSRRASEIKYDTPLFTRVFQISCGAPSGPNFSESSRLWQFILMICMTNYASSTTKKSKVKSTKTSIAR